MGLCFLLNQMNVFGTGWALHSEFGLRRQSRSKQTPTARDLGQAMQSPNSSEFLQYFDNKYIQVYWEAQPWAWGFAPSGQFVV